MKYIWMFLTYSNLLSCDCPLVHMRTFAYWFKWKFQIPRSLSVLIHLSFILPRTFLVTTWVSHWNHIESRCFVRATLWYDRMGQEKVLGQWEVLTRSDESCFTGGVWDYCRRRRTWEANDRSRHQGGIVNVLWECWLPSFLLWQILDLFQKWWAKLHIQRIVLFLIREFFHRGNRELKGQQTILKETP